MDEVGFSRRSFLWRTGSLGAAASVALYPSIAKAAGVLDPVVDEIAAPALKILARDTIAGWLKAGVIEDGAFTPTREGTPQGGVITPPTQVATSASTSR